MRDVTILGAGLVGSVLAILMRQKGYRVTIYERRSDMRLDNNSAGRSINLAMSQRGWKALEYADIRSEIQTIALPMKGRYLHQIDGSTAFQAYGKNGEAIYSVSRSELNKKLMDKAEKLGTTIHFNHRCHKVDVANNTAHITNNNQNKTISCDLLIGADGAFSALRTAYSHLDRANYQQSYIKHGYKELSIPPNNTKTKKWLINNDGLHIWPRHNFMMIALPNIDGSFTSTLFFPFEGPLSFNTVKTSNEVNAFMKAQFPDAYNIMPSILEDFKNNPTSSLVTIKIHPWKYQNKSCIIGDAAHAVVPFYGQGMNAGFEDCTILFDLMQKHDNDWDTILSEYEKNRKPNGDAVADLSLLNFIEMRDKVADPIFLERKKIEKELGRLFPNQFNSVYEMVSFSHIPYAKALHCTQAQDKLLESILKEGNFFNKIKQPQYRQKINQKINQYTLEIAHNTNP